MSRFSIVFLVMFMLAATGCVSLPTGPSVMVLPGSGVSFEQFRNDDAVCQQYASFQVGGTSANQAAVNSGVTSAAVGTALGAAAGAALGGGRGAAIGAGTGLVGGSLVGTGAAGSSLYATQDHYDVAYIQCMYAKGHQVPVSGQFSNETSRQAVPPSSHIPPPPPGSPPPAPTK
ncbi:MAG TPA: glycine zipper family protein [Methylobacter sp.]|jgi:hypothetical protein